MDVDSWLEVVLSRAAALRAAGVLSIGIDGCTATFAPRDPLPPDDAKIKSEVVEPPLDPFEDPAAYPGGFVPSFEIKSLEE